MNSTLPIGKIHPEFLSELLDRYTARNGRVVVGSGIGEDAAVIDMGDRYLIAKTDPITCATDQVGYYVVNINANDIAAMGGMPRWFLATVLVPEGTDHGGLELIFSQISSSCRELEIVYCGGHTEVTTGVKNPVVIGQMLGEAGRTELRPSSEARNGDDLVMTKSAAIEATSLIAREREAELAKHFSRDFLARARQFLYDPGISVLKEARVLAGFRGIHAYHDPTEGGISTGIYEMAKASGLGCTVVYHAIPVREETAKLCEFYGIDPLGTFASGSMLMSVAPHLTDAVINKLASAGIPASKIGTLVSPDRGMILDTGDGLQPLPVYHQDELSRIL